MIECAKKIIDLAVGIIDFCCAKTRLTWIEPRELMENCGVPHKCRCNFKQLFRCAAVNLLQMWKVKAMMASLRYLYRIEDHSKLSWPQDELRQILT